jgi:putative transposase
MGISEATDAPLTQCIQDLAHTGVRYGYQRIRVWLAARGGRSITSACIDGTSWPGSICAPSVRVGVKPLRIGSIAWSSPHGRRVGALDFVGDALFDGRRFRSLTVADNVSRECLAIVGAKVRGEDVVRTRDTLRCERGAPRRLQADNGSQFVRAALQVSL